MWCKTHSAYIFRFFLISFIVSFIYYFTKTKENRFVVSFIKKNATIEPYNIGRERNLRFETFFSEKNKEKLNQKHRKEVTKNDKQF